MLGMSGQLHCLRTDDFLLYICCILQFMMVTMASNVRGNESPFFAAHNLHRLRGLDNAWLGNTYVRSVSCAILGQVMVQYVIVPRCGRLKGAQDYAEIVW